MSDKEWMHYEYENQAKVAVFIARNLAQLCIANEIENAFKATLNMP